MATKRWAMGLVLFSTVLASSGQILIKSGLNAIEGSILQWIVIAKNPLAAVFPIIMGYLLYAGAAAFLIYSLRHGELSILYPIYAMNFVWVAILSPSIFPDHDFMNATKWAGVMAIVLGVALLGLGSGEEANG